MLNLTPHPIVIMGSVTGESTTIPPSGVVARVEQTYTNTGTVSISGQTITVVRADYGNVTGLPDGDDPIIVSGMVLAALKGRPNTYAPDTGAGAVRDENGRITAVTRLIAA